VYDDGSTECVEAGTGTACEAAEYDDCPVHQVCLGDGSGNYACYTVCDTADGTPCVAGEECTDLGMNGEGFCLPGGGCTDGQTQCLGTVVQTCTGGQWVSGTDCAASGQTCSNGACVGGGCTDGQTQCLGTVVQTCTGGQWVSGTDCAATGKLCRSGACVDCTSNADCAGRVCTSGSCTPCTDPGAAACDAGLTCDPGSGQCVSPATQDVGDPCGDGYGECLPDLLCLGYEGFTFHCYASCTPADDPFCQPGNTEACVGMDDAQEGYCEFGGDIPLDDRCDLDDGRDCVVGTGCIYDSWYGHYYCTRLCDYDDDDPGCPGMYVCRDLEDPENPGLGYCW
jgi:hypothetical protein